MKDYNMEDYNNVICPVPQQLTIVLDYIEEIVFQYQGMEITLRPREILSLLDFIQYLQGNSGNLEKIFWKEKLNDTNI